MVNNDYVVESGKASEFLADALFGVDDRITLLAIEKSTSAAIFRGKTASGQELADVVQQRFSCSNSILTLVLDDQGGGNGLYMEACSRTVELFSRDETLLDFRFVDTTLAFFFIIPFYASTDELFPPQRKNDAM